MTAIGGRRDLPNPLASAWPSRAGG